MKYEIVEKKSYVKFIGLTENDLVACDREVTLTHTYTIHFVKVADLEYSKEDMAFCCPKHRIMLLKEGH